MEQHPVPRQITTFEFKLVGFMTLKQFLYLVVFVPIGLIVWKLVPVPILNIILGVLVGLCGAALAFVPINDRPLDVWVRNFLNRLTGPTQYFYHKHNMPLYFIDDLFFTSDPHRVLAHIESREKLAQYEASKQGTSEAIVEENRQQVATMLQQPTTQLSPTSAGPVSRQPTSAEEIRPRMGARLETPADATPLPTSLNIPTVSSPNPEPLTPNQSTTIEPPPKRPFFIGLVKNSKKIPLSGILIYVKDETGKTVRLLKTNPHGVFATYNALLPGTYEFEVKDPKGGYFFDTMKLPVGQENLNPFEFYSKELL